MRLGPEYLHQDFMSEVCDFPPYQLDIYLPEWHACVEIDGPAHFSKRDAERDKALMEQYSLMTLRIDAKKGLRHSVVLQSLTEFIELAATTAAQRKAQWQTRR